MAQDPTSIIDELYKRFGVNDAGRGGGFADRAYWLEHPSEILNGRLESDLGGTGPDQPTGTPGTGPWQNSGKTSGPGLTPSNMPTGTWTPGSNLFQQFYGGEQQTAMPPTATGLMGDPTAAAGGVAGSDPTQAYQQMLRDELMRQLQGGTSPQSSEL